MKVIQALDLDLYRPQGITDGDHAFERISYFKRTLSGNARSQFNKIYEQARKKSLDKWSVKDVDPEEYDLLIKDRAKFSEWTSHRRTGLKAPKNRLFSRSNLSWATKRP